MSQSSKNPFQIIMGEDGIPEIISDGFRERTPEEIAERKQRSAQCGHVKRRLNANEPLTGKTLEFALDIVGEPDGDADIDKFCRGIAAKLKAGQPLTEYEHHMIVDVWLLHTRLAP